MMRRISNLLLPVVLMFIAGCTSVESVHPLSPQASSTPDRRLEGMWRNSDGKTDSYLYIAYRKNGIGSLVLMGSNDGDGANGEKMNFFVTPGRKFNYLNCSGMRSLDGKAPQPNAGGYTFSSYRFSWRGQLVLAMANGDGFAKAVKAGKLKGKLRHDKNGNVTDVLLTDSSDHILKFIESAKPEEVFGPVSSFSKIGEK